MSRAFGRWWRRGAAAWFLVNPVATTMDALSTFAGGVAQAVGLDAGGASAENQLGKKSDQSYVATDILMVKGVNGKPYAVFVVGRDHSSGPRGKPEPLG